MRAMSKQLMVGGLLVAGLVGSGHAAYERMASDVVCRVEMEKDIFVAGRSQTAIVKVTLDAPVASRETERPPVNLTIVLDRSGSMSGEKIARAKEAAITALRLLGPRDLFSLVTYDHRVETVVPAQSAANSEWIERRIRSIQSDGSTAIFAGISQGASEIRKNIDGEYIHRMLLLSDGRANFGPSSTAELGRLGTALRKEGISVTTIGVGTDYNEDLMTRMAQNSDGNTYFVESSVDLPRIFSAELGDVLTVVASQVSVEIHFPEDVRPIRFIGRDGRMGAHSAELSLNQLYGGQEKYALIEVELPAGEAGEQRQVAEAHCRYQNRIRNVASTSRASAQVQFSASSKESDASVNVVVLKEAVKNKMALAQDEAVGLADDQDYEAAAVLLRQNSIEVQALADRYELPELKEEAESLDDSAVQMEAGSNWSPVQRKTIKTRSFSIFNQQKTGE